MPNQPRTQMTNRFTSPGMDSTLERLNNFNPMSASQAGQVGPSNPQDRTAVFSDLGQLVTGNNQPFSPLSGDSALEQASNLFAYESLQQRLATEQSNRERAQMTGDIQGLLGDIPGSIRDSAEGGVRRLDAAADETQRLALGQNGQPIDFETFDRISSGITQGLGEHLQTALQTGQGAVRMAMRTMSNFADTSTATASVIVDGLTERFRQQSSMLDMARDERGNPLTLDQMRDMRTSLFSQTMREASSAAIQLYSRFNETQAQLGMQVAGMQQSQAGLESQAAATQAQVGTQLLGQRADLMAEASRVRTQVAAMVQPLRQQAAQITAGVGLSILQARMAGLEQLASYQERNPYALTSMMSGVLALQQMANTRTGRPAPLAGQPSTPQITVTGPSNRPLT